MSQNVIVTGITAKGMAYLWIANHVKPRWLRDCILEATFCMPIWVFKAIGFSGKGASK